MRLDDLWNDQTPLGAERKLRWHELRAGRVTATDVHKVLYGSAEELCELYQSKRECLDWASQLRAKNIQDPKLLRKEVLDFEYRNGANYQFEQGRMNEDLIANMYLARTGYPSKYVVTPGRCHEHPLINKWLLVSTDMEIFQYHNGVPELMNLCELKSPTWTSYLEVPMQYWWQCQLQMYVTNLDQMDFYAVHLPTTKQPQQTEFFAEIPYCEAALQCALPILEAWWDLCQQANEEGAPSMSKLVHKFVNFRHKAPRHDFFGSQIREVAPMAYTPKWWYAREGRDKEINVLCCDVLKI